jgi:hypothetical protein
VTFAIPRICPGIRRRETFPFAFNYLDNCPAIRPALPCPTPDQKKSMPGRHLRRVLLHAYNFFSSSFTFQKLKIYFKKILEKKPESDEVLISNCSFKSPGT